MALKVWAFTVLAVACGATPAEAADNIACVETGYSEVAQSDIDRLLSSLSLNSFKGGGLPDEMVKIVASRAQECAKIHNWSSEALQLAGLYQLGRLATGALEAKSRIPVSQLNKLREAYKTADRAIMNRVMGLSIEDKLAGNGPSAPSRADQDYFTRLLVRTGIAPDDANADFIGGWWAAQDAVDTFARRFAAQ
jgi:hypothetical protein